MDIPVLFRELNIWSMMLRVLLSMLAGGIVGLEREQKGRAAGFRTYMLVALGASVTVILSLYLDAMLSGPWAVVMEELGIRTDVSRFGAQVINGVGFLGAGTVIVTSRQEVKGLTTAAGLWVSACMGLALGAGFYIGAGVCFVLVLLCLRIMPLMEDRIISVSPHMNFHLEMDGIENLHGVMALMREKNYTIFDVDFSREMSEQTRQVNAVVSIGMPEPRLHAQVLTELSTLRGVISIEEI